MKEVKDKVKYVKIRILDKKVEEQLLELKALPEYSKSYTGLINDAVRLGLPLLYNEIFGEVEIKEDNLESKMYDKNIEIDAMLDRITELLEEINMNAVLTRSTSYSLFGLLENIVNNHALKSKFKDGELSETPEYLKDYEDRVILEFDRK